MSDAVWFVALFGGAATLAGLALRAGLHLPVLERLHPRTRARVVTAGSLLPVAAGALVLAATFVPHPWLGLPDHCLEQHGHLHLCLSCGLPTPPLALGLAAALYAAWVLRGAAAALGSLLRARRALARLGGAPAAEGELSVLPMPGHVAFVAGFLRPRIYVSEATRAPGWCAVLAHERDHARHRDPLARLALRLALVVAPGVSAWLERQLARAQELAADEAAAVAVGDRLEVARQLLAWARQQRHALELALAFGHGDVKERVHLLIDPPRYLDGPSRRQLGVLLVALPLTVLLLAPSIHHGVEELVHLLEL
jgi:Zn-dependent protease with chaperone function